MERDGPEIRDDSPTSPVSVPYSPSGGPEGFMAWGLSWFLAPFASELADVVKSSARGFRDQMASAPAQT
jgi:hypothetical protein